MPTRHTTYKYHFKVGRKTVYTGVTNDIDRREAEHRERHGWEQGRIVQVGHRTTREDALAWEAEQLNHAHHQSLPRRRAV